MASTPEGVFKRKFCSQLKKLGCIPIQYQQTATTVKGFPDTLVLLPEGLTVYIEFKASARARFQPLQKEWIKKLQDMGYFCWVCHPANADQVLKEIKDII